MIELQAHLDWFERFTARYNGMDPGQADNVQLKIDHTLRVLQEARQISLSLDLSPAVRGLVELAALYHDIGRFPQLIRFGTFQDSESVNHGLLGFKTLRSEGVLEGLSRQERATVLQAVNLHNRASVPEGLPRGLDLVLRVIRDADKLDVISVLLSRFDPGTDHDGMVTLGLKHDSGSYSGKALDQVLQGRIVQYRDMVWVNDFRLLLCSWVYDLNFDLSRARFLERGYIESLIGQMPGTEEIDNLKTRLMGELGSGTSGPGL